MKKIISLVLVLVLALTAIGGTLAYFTDTDEANNTFTLGNVKLDLFEHEINEKGVPTQQKTKKMDYEEALVPGHVFAKDPTIVLINKGYDYDYSNKEDLATLDSEDAYVYLDMTMNKHKSLFPVMALDALENKTIDEATFNKFIETTTKTEQNDEGEDVSVEVKTFKASWFLKYMMDNKAAFQTMINRWFTGIDHTKWQLMDIFYDHSKADVTVPGDGDDKYLTFRFAYIGDEDGENKIAMEAGDSITFMKSFQMPATVTQEMIEHGLTKNNFNTERAKFQLDFTAHAIQADLVDKEGVAQTSIVEAYDELFGYESCEPKTSISYVPPVEEP